MKSLRLAIVLGLGLALSLPAAPALAAGACEKACPKQLKGCKKRCEGKKGKPDPDCLQACDDQAILCPQMCAVAARNKGHPAAMKKEAKEVLYRNQASGEVR